VILSALMTTYRRLPGWDWFDRLRILVIMMACLVVMLIFCMDMIAHAQIVAPHSVYEVQQYDHLKSTDADVAALRAQIAQIEADRQKRRDENEAWREEMRDRMTRVETVGSVAMVGIGLLNMLGFIRKPKGGTVEES
jgi:hypothetical protein